MSAGIYFHESEDIYMFRVIWEFAQSRECVTHSQNPEIAFQSRDCANYVPTAWLARLANFSTKELKATR